MQCYVSHICSLVLKQNSCFTVIFRLECELIIDEKSLLKISSNIAETKYEPFSYQYKEESHLAFGTAEKYSMLFQMRFTL